MQNFEFYSAETIEDGLVYLSERAEGCRIIAGGTDLIPLLRTQEVRPAHVLDILNVADLKGVRETGDGIRIGPATTFTEMEASELLQREASLLVQAAASVGGPQIRNRGTVGGNIATASPAADVLPALMALDAALEIRSSSAGIRVVPLVSAIEKPYAPGLRPGELITGILLPKPVPGTRGGFEKLGRRNALARARMNMSVVLRMDSSGRLAEIRIVPGAVMPVARRMGEAESILQGQRPEPDVLNAAAEALAEGILSTTGRRWSSEYKIPVVKNVFKRVLQGLI